VGCKGVEIRPAVDAILIDVEILPTEAGVLLTEVGVQVVQVETMVWIREEACEVVSAHIRTLTLSRALTLPAVM
jgi:hypothetical protein